MSLQNSQRQLHNLLRGGLLPFLTKVFHTLNPGKRFFDSWHLDAISYRLEQCQTGRYKRLIITLPPRTLKSISASIAFPAYLLGHDPSKRILCISYSINLELDFARDFRTVVETP
jgi:hypothetical protein